MRNMSTKEQIRQDAEYQMPYHYISKMPKDGFKQHFVDEWGINYISTIELILQEVEKANAKKIIDIGCGDGRLSRELYLSFANAQVFGIDYSRRAIDLAIALNPADERLAFATVDILTEEPSKKYDVAILMEVLEHIPIDQAYKFLGQLKKYLEPRGQLLLTVPHINKSVEYKHFQHFSINTLTNLLEPHFEIIEITPFEKKSIWRWFLNMLLCNRVYVLNNERLLNIIYQVHKKYLFECVNEHQCQRLFVKAKPRTK